MFRIISQLFVNACIVITFLTLGNHFIKEEEINSLSSIIKKIVIGLTSGFLGFLLMLYGVSFAPQIFIDFRYIPVIIMALYVSAESAFTTAIVIGIFRVAYFGISKSSIIAFISVIIIVILCRCISKFKITMYLKWILSVLSINSIVIIALFYSISDLNMVFKIAIYFCVSMTLVSFVMYLFSEHIVSTNQIYRQMKNDTNKDFLTGLNNMRQFNTLLNSALKSTKDKSESLSLLYIDIDFFKKVNDEYGHLAGNQILKELGEILTGMCRSFDIVSRNGGEEFSVILLDCRLTHAIETAERIRKAIEQHNFNIGKGKKINITVSIGVSSFPDTTNDLGSIVEQSDKALYKAKNAGRNRVEAY